MKRLVKSFSCKESLNKGEIKMKTEYWYKGEYITRNRFTGLYSAFGGLKAYTLKGIKKMITEDKKKGGRG